MKLYFKRSFNDRLGNLLIRCGYHQAFNTKTKEVSYRKRVGRLAYPQFHIFINQETANKSVLNLHLDAKKPSYPGYHAHSAEYDSEVVKKEAERIKHVLDNF